MKLNKTILALELCESVIRAAVVARRGAGGYGVIECVEVPRGERDYADEAVVSAEDIAAVTARLGSKPGATVLVSHDVRTVHLGMDQNKLREMKPSQIQQALRWEAEAYSGVPAADSMVGYELPDGAGSRKQVEIPVAVFATGDYRELKQTLADCRLRLKRLYSDEAALPPAAAFGNGQADALVAGVEEWKTTVFTIRANGPTTCTTVPIGAESIKKYLAGEGSAEVEATLRESFEAVDIPAQTVLVSGPGGDDETVVGFIGLAADRKAKPLPIRCEAGTAVAGKAKFAVAIGAGLRELGFARSSRTIGISDAIPLSRQIRKRVHIFPVALAAVVLLGFLLAYLHIQHQESRCKGELSDVRSRLREIESIAKDIDGLKKRRARLEIQRKTIRGKTRFLTHGAGRELVLIESFLDALMELTPAEMQLSEISQDGENKYIITGEAMSLEPINKLATELQKQQWCAIAKASISTEDAGGKVVSRGSIEVTLARGTK